MTRTTLPALAVIVACAGTVAWRAAHATTPTPKRAEPNTRQFFASNVQVNEESWRAQSAEAFPADNWSQSDDFHAREASRIRELAKERSVPYEEVIRAIDEDLHRHPAPADDPRDPRGARAVPCKPRPFYD